MWVPDTIQAAVSLSSHVNVDLGCVWDQAQCDHCDSRKMQTRCALLSHDQAVCESQIGTDYRCVWAAQNKAMMLDVVGTVSAAMRQQITATDILLGLTLFVSVTFAVYQCYRWMCGPKEGYEKVPDTAGPGVPTIC